MTELQKSITLTTADMSFQPGVLDEVYALTDGETEVILRCYRTQERQERIYPGSVRLMA